MKTTPLSPSRKRRFSEKLLNWYSQYKRDLPWRRTHDPYTIVVSEMMLQQTQVDRVIPKFDAWMKRWPNVEALSKATPKQVISMWQGLGYNRRALYLHKIAKAVVTDYGGKFPHTRDELLELPGIGPYTAGALMSFAFKKEEPIVDTNVVRVLGRVFIGYKDLPDATEQELWNLSRTVLPKKGDVYNFNQGLMDFGSITCQLRKPKCGECPFARMCASYPEILDAKPAELRYRKKSEEKQYFGQPRRIWRGRILKYLHTVDADGGAPLGHIGGAIQNDYNGARDEWLEGVLSTMIKDELIKKAGTKYRLP